MVTACSSNLKMRRAAEDMKLVRSKYGRSRVLLKAEGCFSEHNLQLHSVCRPVNSQKFDFNRSGFKVNYLQLTQSAAGDRGSNS